MELDGKKGPECFVCGRENLAGLRVPFEQEGDGASIARYTALQQHSGWNGVLHGGVLLSLMDEALGWCLYFKGIPALTARLETRFHKPAPIGARLRIRAWITGQRRNLYEATAEIRTEDGSDVCIASSTAVMYAIERSGPAMQGGQRGTFKEKTR